MSVYPHDQDLYNFNRDLAPNAVFNDYWHVDSWQGKQGIYRFAVSRFKDGAGRQGIHYKVPLNEHMDIAFVIYGAFSSQQGHPKAPDAIFDILSGIQLVKPDLEGKLSRKEDMAILNR